MLQGIKTIELRYAEALAQLAIDNDKIAITTKSFNKFIKFLNEEKEIRKFLFELEYDKTARKELLDKIFENSEHPLFLKDFIKLLIDKDRIQLARGIRNEYLNIVDKLENKIFAKIFSPYRLGYDQIKKLKELIKKRYNAKDVNVQQIIDKEIVGGIRIQVGDTIVDYSIKGILNKMLREIK